MKLCTYLRLQLSQITKTVGWSRSTVQCFTYIGLGTLQCSIQELLAGGNKCQEIKVN
jgi:hypothetical protein